jgi:hypothetical protein
MSKATGPSPSGDVIVRCDPCARDLGRAAPALARCVRLAGHWTLMALERHGLRRLDLQQQASRHERQLSNISRPTSRTDSFLALRGTRGVDLVCRRCSHRPRVSRRKLYELAEQALAAGRHDAYL